MRGIVIMLKAQVMQGHFAKSCTNSAYDMGHYSVICHAYLIGEQPNEPSMNGHMLERISQDGSKETSEQNKLLNLGLPSHRGTITSVNAQEFAQRVQALQSIS